MKQVRKWIVLAATAAAAISVSLSALAVLAPAKLVAAQAQYLPAAAAWPSSSSQVPNVSRPHVWPTSQPPAPFLPATPTPAP